MGNRNWGAAALLKAVWWDLRLASLLTQLLLLLLNLSALMTWLRKEVCENRVAFVRWQMQNIQYNTQNFGGGILRKDGEARLLYSSSGGCGMPPCHLFY